MIPRDIHRTIDQAWGKATDFVAAGKALQLVRDERLFEPEYPTFRECARHEFGIGGSTADELIRAADVAEDIDVPLDYHIAQLLWRFGSAERRSLATQIQDMSIREATRLVLEQLDPEPLGFGTDHSRDPLVRLRSLLNKTDKLHKMGTGYLEPLGYGLANVNTDGHAMLRARLEEAQALLANICNVLESAPTAEVGMARRTERSATTGKARSTRQRAT